MRTIVSLPLFLILACALTSCGATYWTRRIPLDPQELAKVKGLVVNHNDPHEMIAIFPDAEGSKKVTHKTAVVSLTSVNELYEIDYCGALFSTRRLEVELHADSSFKRASITSTSSASDDLSALATATEALGEAKKAIEEAKEADPADPADIGNEALQKEILKLMLEANLEALDLGEPPPYPDIIG